MTKMVEKTKKFPGWDDVLSNFDDFVPFLEQSCGLFWRMKADRKEIEFLNKTEISGITNFGQLPRLLQNLVWAQEVVVEDDFFRFKLFVLAARECKEASVLFRVKDREGNRYWLRGAGAPAISDPSTYYGVIRDVTGQVGIINRLLDKDLVRQTMIEYEDHPVMLVDMENKSIISRNTYAYRLFEYTFEEFNNLKFHNLFPKDQESRVSKIYEVCLLEGYWEGKLLLVKKGDSLVDARVKIKRMTLRDRNLLKISIHESVQKEESKPVVQTGDMQEFSNTLAAAIEGKTTMEDILDTLLHHQYRGNMFDAVLYADVYINKRRVDVYARGSALDAVPLGTSFPYEGTVSQAIQQNRMEFYFLDDALESTRPIDWALFIPHGIRSYFAKPFFHGDKLRSLLVLCSCEPRRFSEQESDLYALYYPAFLKGLKNWRKSKKTGDEEKR